MGIEVGSRSNRDSPGQGNPKEDRALMNVSTTRAERSLSGARCAKRQRAGDRVSSGSGLFIDEPGDDHRIAGRATPRPKHRAEVSAKRASLIAMPARQEAA